MRREFEMQGPDSIPENMEDIVFIRTESGEFTELDIPDDEDGEEEC